MAGKCPKSSIADNSIHPSVFLLPFLRLPSSAEGLSPGSLSLHTMNASFKLASMASVVALAGILPLIIAGVPCLSTTAPSNILGGRLGSLTDLSLLRLLDALDPSPGSIKTSTQLHVQPYSRALMSTITPAISSARIRLIIILVLVALFSCVGGLFIVARLYAGLVKYQKTYETKVCGGMDMVIISAADAPGLKGWTEAEVTRWMQERCEGTDASVAGLFAIP